MTDQVFIPADITELPFGLPGRIYRSPMPFGSRDPRGELIAQYHERNIAVVVALAPAEEMRAATGRDLKACYQESGFELLHLPIRDYGIPDRENLRRVISSIVQHAGSGRNIAVHCNAGIGRTGLIMACLTKEVMGFDSAEAIRWVRMFIPGALETQQQIKLASSY